MGSKYTTQSTSGYNASPPPDDGTQVASNLVTWAGVKTKLADVLKTFGEAINTALVSALDLSARAISTPDTAVASDHWKTLQVTGNTTITLSSAASMGAGYEVGIFNAGTGVVTVTPGAAADTINGLSASVTVSIKGTKIFRTNQALTGYNVVGGSDPQTVTATTSVVTPLVGTGTDIPFDLSINAVSRWRFNASGAPAFAILPFGDNTQQIGSSTNRLSNVFTPIIDSGTTGSLSLKTNNGTTQFRVDHIGSAVNFLSVFGNVASATPVLQARGSDTDVGVLISSQGAGSISFLTNNTGPVQLQVLHTASATRNITVTGSNGGNPTLSTTAGSLAITPNIVQAGGISGAGNIATTGSAAWGTGVANFGTITKRKTADESVTSSTVLQDDDHLTFAIAANEEWVASFQIDAGNALNLTGFQAAVTVPSGATLNVTLAGNPAQTGGSYSQRTSTSGGSLNSVAAGFASSASGVFIVTVWVLNGATPGNVTLQWAQGTSSGTALTFRKGSFLQATRVA